MSDAPVPPVLTPSDSGTRIVDALNSVSPTGKPIINPKVVPWIAAALPFLGLLLNAIPAHTVVGQALRTPGALFVLGAVFGVSSPGLRNPKK